MIGMLQTCNLDLSGWSFPRLPVLQLQGVLKMLLESICLKRMDRDHCLGIDLSNEADDVISINVTAGMDFDQITVHFPQH